MKFRTIADNRRVRALLGGAVLATCAAGTGIVTADGEAILPGTDQAGQSEPPSLTPSGTTKALGLPGEPNWSWEEAGTTALMFRLEIRGLKIAATPDGFVFSLPGQAHSGRPGTPELPFLAKTRPGMPGLTARLELKPVVWTEITNIDVCPVTVRVLADVTTNAPTYRFERIRAEPVYGVDAFWPADLASIQEAWMGTQKLIRVECCPMQFNPGLRVARYAVLMEGAVVLEPERKTEMP